MAELWGWIYVVVGQLGGRLAESGASVIVLEAGKTDDRLLVTKPGIIGPMHSVPQLKKIVDWGYCSVPQKHLLGRAMPVPHGKVVGGSRRDRGVGIATGSSASSSRNRVRSGSKSGGFDAR